MKRFRALVLGCILLVTMFPQVALAGSCEDETVHRVFGSNRFETSTRIADMLMEHTNTEQFTSVIIASGSNFPDALTGSYLAAVTGAPIILTGNKHTIDLEWFSTNVANNATIYILGGTTVVSEAIEAQLKDYHVKRLAGANRYATNLIILQEAMALGGTTQDILVCTGSSFADSLSASATGKPILLVSNILTSEQKAFLFESDCERIYILGGRNAVDTNIENDLHEFASVKRIQGSNRYETSVKIAEAFFPHSKSAVLAYAKNFPDGLCGGPLAFSMNAPLILTASGHEKEVISYCDEADIHAGVVLGGEKLISDDTAMQVFGVSQILTYERTKDSICAHSWQDATCFAPKTCTLCGTREGPATGHSWQNGSCTSPKICLTCGTPDGNGNDHDWKKLGSTNGDNLNSTIIRICQQCLHLEEHTVGEVDFFLRDTLPDGNGKKVKVILLGGQSNASGCSQDAYLAANVTSEKYEQYNKGFDNVYINYYVSGVYESQGFTKCATRQGEIGTHFGPELGLAEKLNELYPNETFFIVKYAWGGSNLFDQWLSPSSSGDTGVLYTQFVKYTDMCIQYLTAKNYQVEIEGMCWMQGESDSFSVDNGINYQIHLSNFIKDIRNQFAPYASADGIAFIDACIADNPVYWVYCDLVNQSKQEVVRESPMNALIDTNAHGLTCYQEPEGSPDLAHYDSLSQIKLGNLFAKELAQYMD